MKIREDGILYVCKLCLVRSQSPIMARRLLKDLKQDVEDKRAQDEASRRVRGIKLVPQKDENKADVEVRPKKAYNTNLRDISSNHGDDEVSDEELTKVTDLLNSFSPPKLTIRTRPNAAKPLRSRPTLQRDEVLANPLVIPASLKRSMGQIHPSLSVKRY